DPLGRRAAGGGAETRRAQGSAQYVAFETLVRPAEMPGQRGLFQPLPWPYVEGLRLDEAMHPLAILAVDLYGETLPNQNGAPIRRAIYVVGMLPAAWYFYLGIADQLGADPQKTLERTLGLWALRFLIACLALTPLRRLGGPNLVRYRRAVGLLAFCYAALHLTVYMLLDQGLDLAAVWADIVKRPYITVGMGAFLIL